MSDNPGKSETIERLIESNARLSRLLELAHADNLRLEKEVQSSKVKIAGLLAGMNFSATNKMASSRQVVSVMLQTMMNEHGTKCIERRSNNMNKSDTLVIQATKEALRDSPDLGGDDLEDAVQSVLIRWEDEAAHEHDMHGEPLDTPSVETCDQWGTGEGRYHGLIG